MGNGTIITFVGDAKTGKTKHVANGFTAHLSSPASCEIEVGLDITEQEARDLLRDHGAWFKTPDQMLEAKAKAEEVAKSAESEVEILKIDISDIKSEGYDAQTAAVMYNDYTVIELKEYAAIIEVDLSGASKKADIVDAIVAYQLKPAEDTEVVASGEGSGDVDTSTNVDEENVVEGELETKSDDLEVDPKEASD